MNQWAFVAAAYVVVFASLGGLLAWAATAMRKAEARADALREQR